MTIAQFGTNDRRPSTSGLLYPVLGCVPVTPEMMRGSRIFLLPTRGETTPLQELPSRLETQTPSTEVGQKETSKREIEEENEFSTSLPGTIDNRQTDVGRLILLQQNRTSRVSEVSSSPSHDMTEAERQGGERRDYLPCVWLYVVVPLSIRKNAIRESSWVVVSRRELSWVAVSKTHDYGREFIITSLTLTS